jgi:hypothetical protein
VIKKMRRIKGGVRFILKGIWRNKIEKAKVYVTYYVSLLSCMLEINQWVF